MTNGVFFPIPCGVDDVSWLHVYKNLCCQGEFRVFMVSRDCIDDDFFKIKKSLQIKLFSIHFLKFKHFVLLYSFNKALKLTKKL